MGAAAAARGVDVLFALTAEDPTEACPNPKPKPKPVYGP
jgi:hypothetical protein